MMRMRMRPDDKITIYDFTTNPNTRYAQLLHKMVFVTIALHVIAYEIAVVLASIVIFAELPSPLLLLRIALFLLIIMPLGYIGRLMRAKYMAETQDIMQVKEQMRAAYVCWYFVG